MLARTAFALVCLSIGAPQIADADSDTKPGLSKKEMAKRAVALVRRGFAVGPTVGAAPAFSFEGETDVQISFGIAALRFDIPIKSSIEAIRQRARKRALAMLVERAARGEPMDETAKKKMGAALMVEIEADLAQALRPRLFERPKLAVLIEGGYLVDSGTWEIRGTVGFGIGPVFASTGVAVQINDGAGLVVPIELAVPMLPGKGPRSPIIDWFARADFAATKRDQRDDAVLIGARLIADFI